MAIWLSLLVVDLSKKIIGQIITIDFLIGFKNQIKPYDLLAVYHLKRPNCANILVRTFIGFTIKVIAERITPGLSVISLCAGPIDTFVH